MSESKTINGVLEQRAFFFPFRLHFFMNIKTRCVSVFPSPKLIRANIPEPGFAARNKQRFRLGTLRPFKIDGRHDMRTPSRSGEFSGPIEPISANSSGHYDPLPAHCATQFKPRGPEWFLSTKLVFAVSNGKRPAWTGNRARTCCPSRRGKASCPAASDEVKRHTR
ncbi:hypothetical protein VTK26DRAFT_8449 [Humicola hyalothermophila]